MATVPIPFAGSELGELRHVCAFFNNDDEKYRVLLPFIKDGFACGDKAVHVVNPDQTADHVQRLATAGIDAECACRNNQLEIRSNTDTYLQNGRFDPNRMFTAFESLAGRGAEDGFRLSRIVCHMDWAAEPGTYTQQLIEFESRVDEVWRKHTDAVICVYDLDKFSGATVIDIMRTHPMIIIGGLLQQNPFYVPPRQFLDEIRARRAG